MRRAITILLLLSSSFVSAQTAVRSDINLRLNDTTIRWIAQYSKEAFEQGTEDFVAYDLLLDGFIVDDIPFRISYIDRTLLVNGYQLPIKYRKHYLQKIDSFLNKYAIPIEKRTFAVISNGFSFEPSKSLPKVDCRYKTEGLHIEKSYSQIQTNTLLDDSFTQDSLLINYLVNDGLIRKPTKLYVRCNSENCWVNDSLIQKHLKERYSQLIIKISGVTPNSINEFSSVSIKKDEVKFYWVKEE